MNRIMTTTLVVASASIMSACGGGKTLKGKEIDYRSAKTTPVLQIPPDLNSLPRNSTLPGGGTRTAVYSRDSGKSDAGTTKTTVSKQLLPSFKDIKLRRNGDLRWLEVQAQPQEVWNKVRNFILSMGLIIAREQPAAGVIETDWAENRANVGTKTQKKFRKWFKTLYSTGTRDKFRIRIERTSTPGTTEIYISHRGMKEVVAAGGGLDTIETVWQPRPSDASLEIELMRLLMVHLGVGEERSKTVVAKTREAAPERAKLNKNSDGFTRISLQDHLDRAWRRVGISIDRIGFTVEDRDRTKGIYYIRYIDPKSEGKKKKRRKKKRDKDQEQYQISLKPLESGTQVAVLNKVGDPEKSRTSKRILGLLYEQLK